MRHNLPEKRLIWLKLAGLTIKKQELDGILTTYKSLKNFITQKKPGNLYEKIFKKIQKINLDERIKQWEKAGNPEFLTYEDKAYPDILKNISEPPPVLFIKGHKSYLSSCGIAIVGPRKPSDYGKICAKKFAAGIALNNITIISGFALGIDRIAHSIAIQNRTPTIAVLGCGFGINYPAANWRLREKIINCGAIITEFPPYTPASPANFPKRNRIISGLSCGVLVIEAGYKSGALITAHFAILQGKDVFAIPGRIFDESSKGTNLLIKKGEAHPVTEPMDLLAHLRIFPCRLKDFFKYKKNNFTHEELCVIKVLNKGEIFHIDDLFSKIELEETKILKALFELESKGVIEELPGKRYILVEG